MVRSIRTYIVIALFLCTFPGYAQTTNRLVYERMLDSLVRVSPLADSLIALMEDSLAISADTNHYTTIAKVIALQDSLNDKLNRDEYNPVTGTFAITDSFYTEDLRTPVSSIRLPGSGAPSSTSYLGGEVLEFTTSADATVFFEMQMPHAREANSNIDIHLHYALSENPDDGDSVRWVLTYTWQNINGQFSAPTTVNYTQNVSDDVDSTHYLESIVTISGTGKTLSSMLICSLKRDVSEDNYGGSVYLLEIDGHYSAKDIVGGSDDTTHFVAFTSVFNLDDSLSAKADITMFANYLPLSAFDDSINSYIAFSFGNDDSLVTGSQVTGFVEGKGYALWSVINDSNFIKMSETTNWDKTASDDLLKTEFDDSVANYINNTAYDATSWNDNSDAPTKNAIRDKIESLSAGGVSDGDKGEIDVSGSGATWTIDTAAVGFGELSAVPKGHIWGLVISNNSGDAANDIDIAVGEASDEGGAVFMVLAGALTKRLDAGWAVGTNQGGLNTGSEANSTWYEVHLIRRTDTGVVDVMFTTTANRATLPAGYTQQRRIGWIRNDGSGNIKAFSQRGNYFTWITQVNDVGTTLTEEAAAVTLTAPPYTIALFRAAVVSTTSVNEVATIVFSEIIEGSVTPANATGIASLSVEDFASADAGHFQLRVDASSQIEHDADNAVATFDISTYGYIDEREQYGNY